MPGATAFTETELPLIHAALTQRPLRDETLVTLGLHTGFRVNELLALDVGHVWDGERVRSFVKLARDRLKGGRGVRRRRCRRAPCP